MTQSLVLNRANGHVLLAHNDDATPGWSGCTYVIHAEPDDARRVAVMCAFAPVFGTLVADARFVAAVARHTASLRERGIAATRQLAKRQITWLRGMPQRHVVACDAPDALAQVLAAAESMA